MQSVQRGHGGDSEAAGFVAGPMVLTGHSAGGHLVARMGCRDVALAPGVRARIRHILPISPVADLRPLLETSMNADLRLDEAEAEAVLATDLIDGVRIREVASRSGRLLTQS